MANSPYATPPMKTILQKPNILFIAAAALLCLTGLLWAQAGPPQKVDKDLWLTFPLGFETDVCAKTAFEAALKNYSTKVDQNTWKHRLFWIENGKIEQLKGGVEAFADCPQPSGDKAIHVAQVVAFPDVAHLADFAKEIKPLPTATPTPAETPGSARKP